MGHRLDPAPRVVGALVLLGPLGVPAGSGAKAASDPLLDAFASPPQRLRPFVRWWWNGSRVTEAEIRRELDVLKAAGVGGVEINTIAMRDGVPPESLAAFPVRPWLSPEWCAAVAAAAEGARERGMTADIIVGSGWPFGGRFLKPAEQRKGAVRLETHAAAGNGVENDLPVLWTYLPPLSIRNLSFVVLSSVMGAGPLTAEQMLLISPPL